MSDHERSLSDGIWHLDPARSSVGFEVPHFYGLMTVKGHFDNFAGSLDLDADPAVELNAKAASLDTGNKKRDEHLRSSEFFDVLEHPDVHLVSTSAELLGDVLQLSGTLEAAGNAISVALDADVRPCGDGEFEIEGSVEVDHRELGMNWSPLGIMRAPSTLRVKGVLRPLLETSGD